MRRRLLRRRCEKRPECNVVGAGFSSFDGEMARVMAGDANRAIWPKNLPCFRVGHILLADMRTVCPKFGSEVRPVVNEKCDASLLRDGHQYFCGLPNFIIAHTLQPQLQRRNVARAKRTFQRLTEGFRFEFRRRDQVKAAAVAHAAFFSRSGFHSPVAASPFMRARCAKARCAAGTFSTFPLHAFWGAACKARP